MEEERRNCFAAITRTKECSVLSRGKSLQGMSAGQAGLPEYFRKRE